jgi:hypothetical protein
MFSRVRKLACTSKLESYAASSLVAGNVIRAEQVLIKVLNKKKYHGPLRSGLVVG